MSAPNILGERYPITSAYLGDITAQRLIRDCGSDANLRNLPRFLKTYAPLQRSPEAQELAMLELALSDAFSAPDIQPLKIFSTQNMTDQLRLHPSVSVLTFVHNATSIWAALQCGERPPRPHRLDLPQQVLVWRQNSAARFRLLGADEAAALSRARSVGDFSKAMAQNYMAGWVESELLAEATTGFTK